MNLKKFQVKMSHYSGLASLLTIQTATSETSCLKAVNKKWKGTGYGISDIKEQTV